MNQIMRRLIRPAIGVLAAALMLQIIPPRHQAAAQGLTRLCISIYNNTTGAMNCVEDWQPFFVGALTSVPVTVKSFGQAEMGMIHCLNQNTGAAFVQIFDTASATTVTLGTTSPVLSLAVGQSATTFYGATDLGIGFNKGIALAATTSWMNTVSPAIALTCNLSYN